MVDDRWHIPYLSSFRETNKLWRRYSHCKMDPLNAAVSRASFIQCIMWLGHDTAQVIWRRVVGTVDVWRNAVQRPKQRSGPSSRRPRRNQSVDQTGSSCLESRPLVSVVFLEVFFFKTINFRQGKCQNVRFTGCLAFKFNIYLSKSVTSFIRYWRVLCTVIRSW